MKVGHSAEKCNRGRTEKNTSPLQQWLPKVSTNSKVLAVRDSANSPTVTEIVHTESTVAAVLDIPTPSAAVLAIPTPSAAALSVPVAAEVRVAAAAVAPSAAIIPSSSIAVSAAPVVAAELDVPVAAEVDADDEAAAILAIHVPVAAAVNATIPSVVARAGAAIQTIGLADSFGNPSAPVASVSSAAVISMLSPTVNAVVCVAASPAIVKVHSKDGDSVIDDVSTSAASVAEVNAQSGDVFDTAVDVSQHLPPSANDLASTSAFVAAEPIVVAKESCSTHTVPLVSTDADIAAAEAANVPLVTDFAPPLKGILNANAPLFNPQNHPYARFSKSFAEALLGETRPLNVSEEPFFFAVKSLEFPTFQMPQFAEFYTSSSFAPPDEASTSLPHEDIYTFSDGDDVPRWPASRELILASLKSFNKKLQAEFSMHRRFFRCPTQRKKLKKRAPISTSYPGLSTSVPPPLNALTFHGPNPYEEQLNENDPVEYESVWRSSLSD